MTLGPGTVLLHYRLVERLGAGGMGEVWRAVDTSLDREVALKLLPAAFARDPERIVRFEREAKLLATLSHPGIAGIYGVHEADGLRFLTMELVRGEDLAETLARGPLPVAEVLDAARQITGALEAAHDSGVIHRDLKPANVRRTPEGRIKLLDFGLAKALETAGPVSGQSVTMTSAGSVAGMILGTAPYMSPEQARGQPVDRRTDLWAFGCLLYEMLTGARAFDGATVTDVLAAIVAGEPDWEKIPATTPLALRRLLRRCLQKDPRKRLRDAGDASLLLDENPEDARRSPAAATRSARRIVIAAVALVAVLAGLAGGWGLARRDPGTPGSSEVAFQRLTYGRGMMRAARFVPDGQTIVYGASWDGPPIKLYLARLDSPESSPIALPPAELLSISRTGELAVSLGHGYTGWMGQGTLARAPLLGGSPREVVEQVRAADWSPDGSQLAIVRRVEGLDQLEYPPGTVLYKTPGYVADVRISPDGERIAFADHAIYADDRGGLAVVDRAGRKTTLAGDFSSIRGVAWAPGGGEIWFTAARDGNGSVLSAADLDGRTRVVYSSISNIELFDITASGRALLANHSSERQSQARLAGWPEARNLVIPGESSIARGIAGDGRSILVTNQRSTGGYETYLVRVDRPGATRLSAGEAMTISPDGRQALVLAADASSFSLSPLGAGETREIPNPEGIAYESFASFLPDGKHIVYVGRRGQGDSLGFVGDVATGAATPFGEPGIFWAYWGVPPVSPDGRFVVLQDARGVPTRWPIAGGEPLAIPGLEAGDVPLAWSEDGATLFVGAHTVPLTISRIELATGRRTPWVAIAPNDTAGLRLVAATITPDGAYWSLSIARLFTDLYVVDGLR